jgi:zinc protease
VTPRILSLGLLVLAACAPKIDRTVAPLPLPSRAFTPPAPTEGRLTNGLRVVVVENHEVPMVFGRLAFLGGGRTDPAGREGLAAVTLDMLDEGAGGRDAAALAAALRVLGADLSASAGDDGAAVTFSTLGRNLGPTLDLLADVVRRPDFPQADWDRLQKRRIAGLSRTRKDADAVAARVLDAVLFGDTYRGRMESEASYGAITTADQRGWWATYGAPEQATLFVGGDTTLAELMPLIEARFGDWKPSTAPPPASVPRPPIVASIQFVDRPGAAQSVVQVAAYPSAPTQADWFPLLLANMAVGGQFTARLNMNLREDKGWTYGANSRLSIDHAGGRWVASAGVHTEKTVPAVLECWKEFAEAAAARPITADELSAGRDSLLLGRPLAFESPDWRLGQEETVWRYQLPADWVATWSDKLRAVQLAEAQQAWTGLAQAPLVTLVVGDGAVVRAPLQTLAAERGLAWVERDVDGAVRAP